jgi:hypothetical protein
MAGQHTDAPTGRIWTRLLSLLSKDSGISTEGWTSGVQMPETPEQVDMEFAVDPEAFEEWKETGGLPSLMVEALHAMEQGLDKANLAVLGLHWDFNTIRLVMADDIHTLDWVWLSTV